jgi:hypothetical protein
VIGSQKRGAAELIGRTLWGYQVSGTQSRPRTEAPPTPTPTPNYNFPLASGHGKEVVRPRVAAGAPPRPRAPSLTRALSGSAG